MSTNDGIFGIPAGLRRRRVTRWYRSSFTFFVPEDFRPEDELLVWLWSGGGAGGGSNSSTANGGWGAPGAFVYKRLTNLSPGQSIAVTIGAGGAPGAAGNVAGGSGGTSSFGSFLTVTGGGGGGGGTSTTVGTTGAAGTMTGQDIGIVGSAATPPVSSTTASPGVGGYPFMAIGGPGRGQTAANTAGVAGTGLASPGSGGRGSTAVAGGAGTAGVLMLQYEIAHDHDSNITAGTNGGNLIGV